MSIEKNTSLPFISIVIPVYNGCACISRCLESCLNQVYPECNYEIIVVDNGSKDNTLEIINKYPVICLKEDKIKSSYAARNKGIRSAKGEIIAFTDSDCITDKNWLNNAVSSFEDPYIGCVAGGIEGYSYRNDVERYLVETNCLSHEYAVNHLFLPYSQTANAFYRRDIFDKIGFFENWVSGGDADLAWRMQLKTEYKLKYEPKALVFHVHRSTVMLLFEQQKKWGYGSVLLYNKYKTDMRARTTISAFNEYITLFNSVIHSIPIVTKRRDVWEIKKRYLHCIQLIGYKVGQVKASLLERCFHM